MVISRALFNELSRLSPGEGTNTPIRKHYNATEFVEVSDERILLEVDNPGVYPPAVPSLAPSSKNRPD